MAEKAVPATMQVAGNIMQSPVTQRLATGALVAPQMGALPQISPTTAPTTQVTPMSGTTPATGTTPQETMSPDGQYLISNGEYYTKDKKWRFDTAQDDWVLNQPTSEGITGEPGEPEERNTLTGYTPEQLYDAAIKAYQSGDKASYTQLKTMYDDETAYQKDLVPSMEQKEKEVNEARDVIDNIDTVLSRNLTWMTGLASPLGRIPGTSGYDTQRMVQQIKDQLSLASVGKLKGQGQVSDAERRMLANAVTALDVNMSQEAFRNELNKVRNILERNLK